MAGSLALLYNCSFATDKFKIARVVPIHKNGARVVTSNYRPISLLSIFNKLLEKLMYKRLVTFLENNSVFFNGQFGFQSNRSTVHATLLIIDKIQNAIEKTILMWYIFGL